MARNDKNRILEDVTIAFRNFEGKEDTYNRAGDRNFAILLDDVLAADLEGDGWNVKRLKPRDDDESGQAYIQVAVSYKARPPKIGMVTSKGLTYLGESEVEMLDWVDIETADVTLNPYEWAVNGKTGVKAYLQSLFLKIEEDYLQLKWTSYVDDNRRQITSSEPEKDYIDGEFYEHPEIVGQIEGAR
jgi:hypothetical protein